MRVQEFAPTIPETVSDEGDTSRDWEALARGRPPRRGPIALRPQRSAVGPDRSSRGRPSRRVFLAAGLIALGFVPFEFLATGFLQARTQHILTNAFRAQVQALEPTDEQPRVGAPIAILDIPSLGLKQIVVEGTTAASLQAGPGHLRNSPLPGEEGNTVIMGRRTTYGGPFREIGNLTSGDPIYLTTARGRFEYRAERAAFLPNDETDPSLGSVSGVNRLTLVTSDPAYFGRNRLVVTARLEGTPQPAGHERPLGVDSSELGLATDFGAVPAVALSLGGVVAALGFAVRVFRAFPYRVAYLLVTPIAIASLVLLYRNFDRLLPAML